MQISVVKDDEMVYVDGKGLRVDVSDLPSFIHAIQWNTADKAGHIEYKPDKDGVHHGNTPLAEFKQYEYLVDRWRLKKQELEEAKEALKKKTESEIEAAQRAMLKQRGEEAQVRKPVKKPSKPK